MENEVVGISPQIGTVGYADSIGTYRARAAAGLLADFNAIPLIAPQGKDFFIGVTTGALYSHVGASSSDYFGSNSDDGSGSNLVVIPVDLKVGYNISDKIRVSAHGGGNVTYRSNAASAQFENDSTQGSSEEWTMLPNVGADIEVALARGINLSLRPDVTFATGQNLYAGTMGVVAPLSF